MQSKTLFQNYQVQAIKLTILSNFNILLIHIFVCLWLSTKSISVWSSQYQTWKCKR